MDGVLKPPQSLRHLTACFKKITLRLYNLYTMKHTHCQWTVDNFNRFLLYKVPSFPLQPIPIPPTSPCPGQPLICPHSPLGVRRHLDGIHVPWFCPVPASCHSAVFLR